MSEIRYEVLIDGIAMFIGGIIMFLFLWGLGRGIEKMMDEHDKIKE